MLCGNRLSAATVTLVWDRNPETDIAGYIVSYGASSGAYSTSVDVGNVTTWSPSLGSGTYYFTVQAYNTSGVRSPFSAEVSTTIQDPAPTPTPATGDLALNRPIVSSSDYPPQYAASYAVDGNSSTRWSSQFSDPQWFYVDLGQRFAISEVKLTWESAYGKDFQISVSDDLATWTPVSTVTNGTGGVNDLAVTGTGRYVGFYGTRRGTQWGYSLWSFEVFGTPATADRALNRPIVSSSDYSPQFGAANAVDGNSSTRWSSQFSDPQWFYVDLGQRFAINEVKLTWESAYGADFQIVVSDDLVTWTPVSTVTSGTGGVNDLAVTATARYVGLYGTRRGTQYGYSLWSFEVFGTPASTDRALNHPIVSSSDFSPQYGAANAVDGNPSTRWSSQFSDPQWFYVDLGQRFAINEVKLTWESAYGADFQIVVSDDLVTWTPVSTVTNGTGGVNDLAVSATARYVGLYGTRRGTQYGYSLWSFEVFGNPSP